MRIVHVVQYYHPGTGGAVRFIRRTGQLLSEQGDTVTILTTNSIDNKGFLRIGETGLKAGSCQDLGSSLERMRPLKLPYIYKYIPGLRPGPILPQVPFRIRSLRPEIVHVHCLPYAHTIAATLGAHLAGTKLVVTPDLKEGMKIYPENIRILRSADLLAVRTTWETEYAARTYGIRPLLSGEIGMGVDLEIYKAAAKGFLFERTGLHEDEHIVLFVGRLTREKGVGDLVKAIELTSDAKLVIVGAETSYFRTLWDDLRQRNKRVFWLGPILDERQLARAYADANLVAYPSRDDSFGAVILEAWASMKPVVTCRVGGIGRVVEEWKNGLFTPFGDPPELANTIELALQNGSLSRAIAKRGHEKATRFFKWESVTSRLRDLYSRILDEVK